MRKTYAIGVTVWFECEADSRELAAQIAAEKARDLAPLAGQVGAYATDAEIPHIVELDETE